MSTMDCTTARARLLEAEPHDLRGRGDAELAAHLAGCAACRARAEAVLAGYAELDAALRTMASPRHPADVIPLRARRARVRRWALPGAGASLAAAAVIALLLARPRAERQPETTADDIARAIFPRSPVAKAEGKSVAVMHTNDPGVTLVWVY
ncbi:MAG TPA: hypothetical protein VFQ45_16150 [Longimicrobium sp.]|nr:hypothetical protein [Longimicrobium sp.]